ncbi:MAG TPA: ZIP family metal transporter [Bacteroidia bacterium]|nr:ZIP family metal transporter [Bacteroidia bacterium]
MLLSDYLILFLSVISGGGLYFLIKNPGPGFLKLLLSFSGAFLFAITVLHLMPEVYSGSVPKIGMWIMAGFFVQIILEFFSEGIEHGHVHVHHHQHNAFPITMMISLCLHSFLEGMPLAGGEHAGHDHGSHQSLLFGIALHHIPVAFALLSMLVASGIGNKKAFFYLTVFALMGPLGAFTGTIAATGSLNIIAGYQDQIMAIVIGIFLHISTTILFETSSDHRFNLYKMMAILLGGIIGILAS